MAVSRLDMKGQLSIEFILLLAVVLILLSTMIIPMRDNSESAVNSFTKLSYLDKALTDIDSAVKRLDSANKGSLLVELYLPEDSNILISGNQITFNAVLDYNGEEYTSNCKNNVCSKTKMLTQDIGDLSLLANARYALRITKDKSFNVSVEQ